MKFVELIASNNLSEAKESILSRLSELVSKKLEEAKRYVAEDLFEEVEYLEEMDRDAYYEPEFDY